MNDFHFYWAAVGSKAMDLWTDDWYIIFRVLQSIFVSHEPRSSQPLHFLSQWPLFDNLLKNVDVGEASEGLRCPAKNLKDISWCLSAPSGVDGQTVALFFPARDFSTLPIMIWQEPDCAALACVRVLQFSQNLELNAI